MKANGRRRFITGRRAAGLVCAVLLLAVLAQAQTVERAHEAPPEKKTVEPSLKIELRALTPTVCVGSPLKLKLVVTNVGKETARLNKRYFWNNYSYYPLEKKDSEHFLTIICPRIMIGDIFNLASGWTYTEDTVWKLDGEKPGKYMLEVWAYEIQNKVEFEISDCGHERS